MPKNVNLNQKTNTLIESILRKLSQALRDLRNFGSTINGENPIVVPVPIRENGRGANRRISI